MSGETEAEPSGWTPDLLKTHLDQRIAEQGLRYFDAMADLRQMLNERYATQTKAIDAALIAQQTAFTAADRAVQAALNAAKEAVAKAETAAEKRFEAVNEFRGQLSDQVATFAPRDYVESQFKALTDRLADISAAWQATFDEARKITATLLPREVYEQAMASTAAERAALRDRVATVEGEVKAAKRASAAYVTALGVAFTLLTILLTAFGPVITR